MGRTGLCVALVLATGAISGCGTSAPDPTGQTTLVAGTPAPSSTFGGGAIGNSTDPIYGPVFPLTLRRTGGIAGYDDTVVLSGDGKVLVNTRSVRGRVCTLTSPQQKQILMSLSTLRLGPAGGQAAGLPTVDPGTPVDPDLGPADRISISITDEGRRPLDLSDPSVGDVSGLVGALLSDVTLSAPATTKCTTPTPPTPAPAT